LVVAVDPGVAVGGGPGVVAADVAALVLSLYEPIQIGLEELDSLVVVHLSVLVGLLVHGMTVLSNIDGNIAVILLDSHQHVVHGFGIDFPAPGVFGSGGVYVGLEPALDHIAFDGVLAGAHVIGVVVGLAGLIGLDYGTGIAVLSQKVH